MDRSFDSENLHSDATLGRLRRDAELTEGEQVIASFQPDLAESLVFAEATVVLTDRRLLASSSEGHSQSNGSGGSRKSWRSWQLRPELRLATHERGGLGKLELFDDQCRLAIWRYTAARNSDARRFEARWNNLRAKTATGAHPAGPTICPSCGEIITSDDGICPSCAPAPPPAPVSALRRLFKFAAPRKWLVRLCLVLALVASAMSLVPAYLTKPLMDDVLVPRSKGIAVSPSLVYVLLALYLVSATLSWLLNWGRLYVTSRLSECITGDLRSRTYSHLQQLSLEFFGGKRTGDLMSRISTDTERICIFLSVNVVDFVNDIFIFALTVIVLLFLSPLLALGTLVTLPAIAYLVYRVRTRLRHGFTRSSVAWGQLNSVLADTIPGIRVVKAFAQERREAERFEKANQHLLTINDRLNLVWAFFGPMVSYLSELGLLCIWGFGAWLIFHDELTIGDLSTFLLLIGRFYTRLETMIRIVYNTQRAAASSQRLFEILDRKPSVPEPAKPVAAERMIGQIELRDVRFKYGTREVLHGLNLKIEPGEMIGLVGASGAGKSTLINLICRFFDVADGAILVDGVDIRSYPLAEYRRHIGIVLQDPFLFYGTIAENIAYGRPEATRQEIVAAARAARAHDFILALSDGYDSLVGERGQSLSGGERQRISIARALLIDPRI
ncbi:MAG: ABC transporter ATP-binding protein, partial [Pirellulales bacterium]|nr:ABC transporter ATP-binding protein [Pirellulales bacterium]